MGIEIEHPFLHPGQQVQKSHISGKLRSQHMGVKKKADHRLQFRAIPIGQRNSQQDILLPRVSIEQAFNAAVKMLNKLTFSRRPQSRRACAKVAGI